MCVIVEVVANLSRKLLQSFLMLLVLEVLQATAKNFSKWVKTFYKICQTLQKDYFLKCKEIGITFIINQTKKFFCLWNECCDQGLVYADNMSITPLLFYFAPETEIGSEIWKIQGSFALFNSKNSQWVL